MENYPHLPLAQVRTTQAAARRENVLLLGNSGTGKTHIALALGLAWLPASVVTVCASLPPPR
jgi:DNA replication protein DnaC